MFSLEIQLLDKTWENKNTESFFLFFHLYWLSPIYSFSSPWKTEGHNVLSTLSVKQYKHVLELMEDAILATDLLFFNDNRAKLDDIVKNNKFSWSTSDHRYQCNVNLSFILQI